MRAHIHDLLKRFDFSEQIKEIALFRTHFGGDDFALVMFDLDIHRGYTSRS